MAKHRKKARAKSRRKSMSLTIWEARTGHRPKKHKKGKHAMAKWTKKWSKWLKKVVR